MKKLSRNPEVSWRMEAHREAHIREILEDPSRTDEDKEVIKMGTVTILADGIMHQLNFLGGEIWKLCDGTLDRDLIVSTLGDLFEIDEATLKKDVYAFVDDMILKSLIYEK